MAPYQSHGFIGQEIHTWIKATKQAHKELFELAEKINTDCYSSLGRLTIDSGSLRQTLISCLFARCLELFQAAYILVAHGMSPSSNIALRALLEAMFVLCATAKDDDALEAYVIDGERERLRVTRKLLADKGTSVVSHEWLELFVCKNPGKIEWYLLRVPKQSRKNTSISLRDTTLAFPRIASTLYGGFRTNSTR